MTQERPEQKHAAQKDTAQKDAAQRDDAQTETIQKESGQKELQTVITAEGKGKKKILFIIAGIAVVLVLGIALSVTALSGGSAKKVAEQLNLGNKYLDELDFERAIMAYEAVLEIDPKNAEAYLGLIEIYGAQEDAGQIAEIYLKAAGEFTGEKDAEELQKVREEAAAQLESLIKAAVAAGDYAKAENYAAELAKVDEKKAATMRTQIADAKAKAEEEARIAAEKAEAERQAELAAREEAERLAKLAAKEQAEAERLAKEEKERKARLAAELEGVGTGEVITFGHYEQDNDTSNGAEPIEWVVLTREEGRALVVSLYALDCIPYNEEYTDVTWETCTLRGWLNDSFYNTAFDATEKGKIVQVTNENPDSYAYFQSDYAKNTYYDRDTSSYGASGGNATLDNIFLLSWEEALNYFASDDARRCKPTAYVIAQGAYSDFFTCWWWLRSPGDRQRYAMVVVTSGGLYYDRGVYIDGYAVRPALWIAE